MVKHSLARTPFRVSTVELKAIPNGCDFSAAGRGSSRSRSAGQYRLHPTRRQTSASESRNGSTRTRKGTPSKAENVSPESSEIRTDGAIIVPFITGIVAPDQTKNGPAGKTSETSMNRTKEVRVPPSKRVSTISPVRRTSISKVRPSVASSDRTMNASTSKASDPSVGAALRQEQVPGSVSPGATTQVSTQGPGNVTTHKLLAAYLPPVHVLTDKQSTDTAAGHFANKGASAVMSDKDMNRKPDKAVNFAPDVAAKSSPDGDTDKTNKATDLVQHTDIKRKGVNFMPVRISRDTDMDILTSKAWSFLKEKINESSIPNKIINVPTGKEYKNKPVSIQIAQAMNILPFKTMHFLKIEGTNIVPGEPANVVPSGAMKTPPEESDNRAHDDTRYLAEEIMHLAPDRDKGFSPDNATNISTHTENQIAPERLMRVSVSAHTPNTDMNTAPDALRSTSSDTDRKTSSERVTVSPLSMHRNTIQTSTAGISPGKTQGASSKADSTSISPDKRQGTSSEADSSIRPGRAISAPSSTPRSSHPNRITNISPERTHITLSDGAMNISPHRTGLRSVQYGPPIPPIGPPWTSKSPGLSTHVSPDRIQNALPNTLRPKMLPERVMSVPINTIRYAQPYYRNTGIPQDRPRITSLETIESDSPDESSPTISRFKQSLKSVSRNRALNRVPNRVFSNLRGVTPGKLQNTLSGTLPYKVFSNLPGKLKNTLSGTLPNVPPNKTKKKKSRRIFNRTNIGKKNRQPGATLFPKRTRKKSLTGKGKRVRKLTRDTQCASPVANVPATYPVPGCSKYMSPDGAFSMSPNRIKNAPSSMRISISSDKSMKMSISSDRSRSTFKGRRRNILLDKSKSTSQYKPVTTNFAYKATRNISSDRAVHISPNRKSNITLQRTMSLSPNITRKTSSERAKSSNIYSGRSRNMWPDGAMNVSQKRPSTAPQGKPMIMIVSPEGNPSQVKSANVSPDIITTTPERAMTILQQRMNYHLIDAAMTVSPVKNRIPNPQKLMNVTQNASRKRRSNKSSPEGAKKVSPVRTKITTITAVQLSPNVTRQVASAKARYKTKNASSPIGSNVQPEENQTASTSKYTLRNVSREQSKSVSSETAKNKPPKTIRNSPIISRQPALDKNQNASPGRSGNASPKRVQNSVFRFSSNDRDRHTSVWTKRPPIRSVSLHRFKESTDQNQNASPDRAKSSASRNVTSLLGRTKTLPERCKSPNKNRNASPYSPYRSSRHSLDEERDTPASPRTKNSAERSKTNSPDRNKNAFTESPKQSSDRNMNTSLDRTKTSPNINQDVKMSPATKFIRLSSVRMKTRLPIDFVSTKQEKNTNASFGSTRLCGHTDECKKTLHLQKASQTRTESVLNRKQAGSSIRKSLKMLPGVTIHVSESEKKSSSNEEVTKDQINESTIASAKETVNLPDKEIVASSATLLNSKQFQARARSSSANAVDIASWSTMYQLSCARCKDIIAVSPYDKYARHRSKRKRKRSGRIKSARTSSRKNRTRSESGKKNRQSRPADKSAIVKPNKSTGRYKKRTPKESGKKAPKSTAKSKENTATPEKEVLTSFSLETSISASTLISSEEDICRTFGRMLVGRPNISSCGSSLTPLRMQPPVLFTARAAECTKGFNNGTLVKAQDDTLSTTLALTSVSALGNENTSNLFVAGVCTLSPVHAVSTELENDITMKSLSGQQIEMALLRRTSGDEITVSSDISSTTNSEIVRTTNSKIECARISDVAYTANSPLKRETTVPPKIATTVLSQMERTTKLVNQPTSKSVKQRTAVPLKETATPQKEANATQGNHTKINSRKGSTPATRKKTKETQGGNRTANSDKQSKSASQKELSETLLWERTATQNSEKQTTAVPQKETSAIPQKEASAIPQKETSAIPQNETSAIPEKETSAITENETSAIPQKETSAIPQKEMTATPGTRYTENWEKQSISASRKKTSATSARVTTAILGKQPTANSGQQIPAVPQKETTPRKETLANYVEQNTAVPPKDTSATCKWAAAANTAKQRTEDAGNETKRSPLENAFANSPKFNLSLASVNKTTVTPLRIQPPVLLTGPAAALVREVKEAEEGDTTRSVSFTVPSTTNTASSASQEEERKPTDVPKPCSTVPSITNTYTSQEEERMPMTYVPKPCSIAPSSTDTESSTSQEDGKTPTEVPSTFSMIPVQINDLQELREFLQNKNASATSRYSQFGSGSIVIVTLGEFFRMYDLDRRPDIDDPVELIKSELRIARELTRVPMVPSSQLFVVPSDSLSELCELMERKLIEEDKPSTWAAVRSFLRRMQSAELPNSTFKKPLKPPPDPPLTWQEEMTAKALRLYKVWYGHLHEKRGLPPPERKQRRSERPPPEPRKKPKKGKKAKKEKKKKPATPPPLDFTVWRREAMPVFSTRLWEPWFSPPLYELPTPQFSRPPTPPPPVPQPPSKFAQFLELIHRGRTKSAATPRYSS